MRIRRPCTLIATAIACATASPVVEHKNGPDCIDPGTPPPCTSGILILGARGTDQKYSDPVKPNPRYNDLHGMEDIAQAIIDKEPESYCRAIKYPAALCRWGGPCPWFPSLDIGIDEGQRVIADYYGRCGPSSRIALLGYSSGAELWISVLVGENIAANAPFSPELSPHDRVDAPPLNATLRDIIFGGVLIASPSFLPGYAIDFGNATTSGFLKKDEALYEDFNNTFSNRIRTYCQTDDFFCANGGKYHNGVHEASVETFKGESITFLRSLGLA